MIEVSVVVPTWNSPEDVRRMLPSVLSQQGVAFEVLVVDNGVVNIATRDVVQVFQKDHSNLRYLSFEKQLGYAGAVNEGARSAKSNLIAVMNNDNLAHAGWLKALVDAYRAGAPDASTHRKVAVVSANIDRPGISSPLIGGMNVFGRTIMGEGLPAPRSVFPVFHPDGSSFLYDRDLLGIPYEEEYFIYHEDVALGWRARLMGYEVLCAPDARGETFDGGSTRRMPYKTVLFTERNRWFNRIAFISWPVFIFFLPLWIFDHLVTLLIGQNRRAKVHAWGEVIRMRGYLKEYRARCQSRRRASDREVFSTMISDYWSSRNAFALVRALIVVFSALVSVYCLILGFTVTSMKAHFARFNRS